MTTVLTYGTYDLFHYGHLRLLKRARAMGSRLYVGLSTDDFNLIKGKNAYMSYHEREETLLACRFVDHVFPEQTWEQKAQDILRYDASLLVMGDDWRGRFDHLAGNCRVEYLTRTPTISSTILRDSLASRKAA